MNAALAEIIIPVVVVVCIYPILWSELGRVGRKVKVKSVGKGVKQ